MTKNYSDDLRLNRVIEYLDKGSAYQEVSKLFKISTSSIGRCYKKYKKKDRPRRPTKVIKNQ